MRLIKINVLNYGYSFLENARIIDSSHGLFLCIEPSVFLVVCVNSGFCVCVCVCVCVWCVCVCVTQTTQRRPINVTCNSPQQRLNKVRTKFVNLNRSQLGPCREESEDYSKGKIGSFFTDGVATPVSHCATRVRLRSSDSDVIGADAIIFLLSAQYSVQMSLLWHISCRLSCAIYCRPECDSSVT